MTSSAVTAVVPTKMTALFIAMTARNRRAGSELPVTATCADAADEKGRRVPRHREERRSVRAAAYAARL